MGKLDISHCNCNSYTEFLKIYKFCESKCGDDYISTAADGKNRSCCRAHCELVDNYVVVDNKINKTAMAKFYGPVGDSKIVESIEVCKTIGKTF